MAQKRVGEGVTLDDTATSNLIKFAGEAFSRGYTNYVGKKSAGVFRDLTGYTIQADIVPMKVTDDKIETAVPLGTCAIAVAGTTFTTREECPVGEDWAAKAPVALTVTETDLANGKWSIYFPSTALTDVGITTKPSPGNLQYISFMVGYSEGGSGTTKDVEILATNILGYKWNPRY